MERNHARLNQTPEDVLRVWRGNCDVQILIYNSGYTMDTIDPADIARVTDYVVAYACKGNKTLKQERIENRNLILRTEEATCDHNDVTMVTKKILNRATSNRIISKQEAVVMLGGLDMVRCSEIIDVKSVAGGEQVTAGENEMAQNYRKLYLNRKTHKDLSMHDYYHATKNKGLHPNSRKYKIPHFVGVSGSPTYPITEAYAKATLIVYQPWNKLSDIDDDRDWIGDFHRFIEDPNCPAIVKMPYERIKRRYICNMTHHEPTAKETNDNTNEASTEDLEIIASVSGGMHTLAIEEYDGDSLLKQANKGIDHDWSKRIKFVSMHA